MLKDPRNGSFKLPPCLLEASAGVEPANIAFHGYDLNRLATTPLLISINLI